MQMKEKKGRPILLLKTIGWTKKGNTENNSEHKIKK